MSPPPRVLVLAHAPLASALREAAMHAFPECAADVSALDVDARASIESVAERLRERLAAAEGPTLVLVDVAGATPANALLGVLAQQPQVRAVAGLNLAMLWRVLCYRTRCASLDELTACATEGGLRGIIRLPEAA